MGLFSEEIEELKEENKALRKEIKKLKEENKALKSMKCKCSEEDKTGTTQFHCCNICGKISE